MDIQTISNWLAKPKPLSETEQTQLKSCIAAYPWFVPARYMEAGEEHSKTPFDDSTNARMQIFHGNWVLYNGMLDELAGTQEVKAVEEIQEEVETVENTIAPTPENISEPVYASDYFRHQGLKVAADMPEMEDVEDKSNPQMTFNEDPKTLMVVMSFQEWLQYFKQKSTKEKEEEDDKKALKMRWQKEKLAAALQEEEEEIPEQVFDMAVNSLDWQEGLASESLAEILAKQDRTEAAIEMYEKLILQNPGKRTYFALQIEKLRNTSTE